MKRIEGGKQSQQRQRRQILTEEDYTKSLSKIITRDFYPALPSLNRDAAILQKRSEGDIAGAVAIRRAARKIAVNEELSSKSEQMEELIAISNGGIRKRPRPIDRETVDGFHARVTSEDNAEFEVNMREEAKQKRERMDLVFQTSGSDYKNVGKLLMIRDSGDGSGNSSSEALGLPAQGRLELSATPLMASDEFNPKVERIQAAGTTKDGKNKSDRNSLFFTPDHYTGSSDPAGGPLSEICKETASTANLLVEAMPPPSNNLLVSVKSSLPSHADNNASTSIELRAKLQKQKMQLVEYLAKPASNSNAKQIIPANTRFSFQNESRIVASSSSTIGSRRQTIEKSPSKSASGTLAQKSQFLYETDSSTTDLDASPLPLDMERRSRLLRIERDRNTYVAMTPLIIPGGGSRSSAGDRDDDSPIVTWGDVASTPLVTGGEKIKFDDEASMLPTGNDGQNEEHDITFQLPANDRTEAIVKAAEAKLAKQSKRFKEAGGIMVEKEKTVSSGTKEKISSRSSSSTTIFDRSRSLTPAARSLLQKATKKNFCSVSLRSSSVKVGARSGSALGSALRGSYTPKIKMGRKKSSRGHSQSTVFKATPLLSSRHTRTETTNAKIRSGNPAGDQSRSSTAGLLKL